MWWIHDTSYLRVAISVWWKHRHSLDLKPLASSERRAVLSCVGGSVTMTGMSDRRKDQVDAVHVEYKHSFRSNSTNYSI